MFTSGKGLIQRPRRPDIWHTTQPTSGSAFGKGIFPVRERPRRAWEPEARSDSHRRRRREDHPSRGLRAPTISALSVATIGASSGSCRWRRSAWRVAGGGISPGSGSWNNTGRDHSDDKIEYRATGREVANALAETVEQAVGIGFERQQSRTGTDHGRMTLASLEVLDRGHQ